MMSDYQVIICQNCGSEWQIERYWARSDITAELLQCPLCGVQEKSEAGQE